MRDVWNIENGHIGETLILKKEGLEWVKYEIPSTSFSGGGSQTYPLQDISVGSRLLKDIAIVFGETVAAQVLEETEKLR